MIDVGGFEHDTLHRLVTEAARYWLLTHWLASKNKSGVDRLPEQESLYAHPSGPVSMDCGDPRYVVGDKPGVMHGKRIKVTFEIEESC